MLRDLTVRTRVNEYLASNGPIEDDGGRATNILKEAIDYQGTTLGFSQLLMAMTKAGEIEREVRGKRTYRVAATSGRRASGAAAKPARKGQAVAIPAVEAESAPAPSIPKTAPVSKGASSLTQPAVSFDSDYEELAAALLARVTRIIAGAPAESPPPSSRRRLDRLEVSNSQLQRELTRARAERDSALAECQQLRDQLATAQNNLDLLTERSGDRKHLRPRAFDRLSDEERALLRQLRASTARKGGAAYVEELGWEAEPARSG